MKITNAIWFTQMGGPLIGIVIGEDSHSGEKKVYIGTASGIDEEEDSKHIASRGAKFHACTAVELYNILLDNKDESA